MCGTAGRAIFFDASALAKLYLDEDRSDVVREAFRAETTRQTSPFCFYETLTLLKVRLITGKGAPRDFPRYLDACARLISWYRANASRVPDLDITHPQTFKQARDIVEKSGLDLSDAFQILSVKVGFFPQWRATLRLSWRLLTAAWRRSRASKLGCACGL